MRAVSCMKHLGLLGIHIIVIRSGDGVLVTIPKRIQKFIMAAGAGLYRFWIGALNEVYAGR